MNVCMHVYTQDCRSVELELQVEVRHQMWVLGNHLGCSQETAMSPHAKSVVPHTSVCCIKHLRNQSQPPSFSVTITTQV